MAGDRNYDRLRGKVVALLGGSGFFGRHVAQELFECGARLRIVSRNPERAYSLKPLGNLGQVQFARCDVTRPETLAPVLIGADAVVNLVGAFAGDLDAVQGKGAGRIAEAAMAVGAQALVHVSALGGNADSPVDYSRTKAEGEEAVRAAFPQATVLRPSILFGPDDNFVNRFAGLIAALPVMPVFGPEARMQPVYVDDAAQAVAVTLAGPAAHGGKVYEVAGPEVITMLEFNRRIAQATGRKPHFAELPDAVSSAFASLTGWLPGAPITQDQWQLLKAGNVASGKLPDLTALGISPRPLDLFLERWLVRYRRQGRFAVNASAG